MKRGLLLTFFSLLLIVTGLGIKTIALENANKETKLPDAPAPTQVQPNVLDTKVEGVRVDQDEDPFINCETKSQGTIRMRKSECLASVDCLVNGKYFLTKNNNECQDLVKKQQQGKQPTNPTRPIPKYNVNAQTTYPSCIVYYPALRYSVTYPNTPLETCKLWQDSANAGGKTPQPTTQPIQVGGSTNSSQSVQDCLSKFAALGSLDSSEAQKCYTDPNSVPSASDDCFKTWEEYFEAHPGYVGNVAGLGSTPPCH